MEAISSIAPDFQAIFDAYPTPILVLSPESVIEAANRALLEIAGTGRDRTVGRPLFEVLPEYPVEPAELRASLAHVLTTGVPERMAAFRYKVRDASGRLSPRWWSPLNVPAQGPDGAARLIIHAVRDVTAEVEAAHEARAALDREAHILTCAKEYAIVSTDTERRVTHWSTGAATIFGYSQDEALGMRSDELFMPEDREAGVPARLADQARCGELPPDDRWRLRKDGSRVFVRGSTRPLYDSDGVLTGYLTIERDETPEQEAVEALRSSEAYFRTLADTMPVLVFVTDASGGVTYTNRRYQEFTGLSAEALAGEGWRQAVHPDDSAEAARRWTAALASGQPFEEELRLRPRAGEPHWFLERVTPVPDGDGVIRHWFAACSDIDEQHKARDRQELLNLEISHRVKNSLQLVSGFLTLQGRRAPEAARPLIEEAAGRVQAVAQVHDQLWRRGAAETMPLGPFLTDLCETLAQAHPRRPTAARFDDAWVAADQAAPIGLVINEALTNAYKYAYPAEQEGAVEVRGARDGGRYRIEIRDWGVGLPDGFDLARPGESLGLRVMNALADQLGAEIRAENARPGARFVLVTPLA